MKAPTEIGPILVSLLWNIIYLFIFLQTSIPQEN